jgi:tetratricopeptide (TPR) repeat protein
MRAEKLPAIFSIFILLLLICASRPSLAQDANAAKAHALVDAAIKMTDSEKAVKLLWQATDIDPTLEEPYIYLGLYYQSKQDFDDLAKVYQKLVKYQPNLVTAWLNVGEAYMSFTPPKTKEALPYYRRAHELDPHSSLAALRLGEILAQQGERDEAVRLLHQAGSDPHNAEEARKILTQMGAS